MGSSGEIFGQPGLAWWLELMKHNGYSQAWGLELIKHDGHDEAGKYTEQVGDELSQVQISSLLASM